VINREKVENEKWIHTNKPNWISTTVQEVSMDGKGFPKMSLEHRESHCSKKLNLVLNLIPFPEITLNSLWV
jgi:hypothetical protein